MGEIAQLVADEVDIHRVGPREVVVTGTKEGIAAVLAAAKRTGRYIGHGSLHSTDDVGIYTVYALILRREDAPVPPGWWVRRWKKVLAAVLVLAGAGALAWAAVTVVTFLATYFLHIAAGVGAFVVLVLALLFRDKGCTVIHIRR